MAVNGSKNAIDPIAGWTRRVEHATRVPHPATPPDAQGLAADAEKSCECSWWTFVWRCLSSPVFAAGRRKRHAGRVLHPPRPHPQSIHPSQVTIHSFGCSLSVRV
jgi:hypothetical protein